MPYSNYLNYGKGIKEKCDVVVVGGGVGVFLYYWTLFVFGTGLQCIACARKMTRLYYAKPNTEYFSHSCCTNLVFIQRPEKLQKVVFPYQQITSWE